MRMTNACIVVILCLVTFTGSRAGEYRYGFKIGLPISDIRMTDMPDEHINVDKPDIWRHDFGSKLGVNLSAFGTYQVAPQVYLGIEPGYILKGANFTESSSKLDLHYVNLPVVLKYEISDRVGIHLGPEFSILLKANLDFNGFTIDMKDFYDSGIETSVFLGAEYEAIELLGLGIRYSYGLTKVSETVWTEESGDIDSISKENNYYLLFYAALGF